MKEEEENPLIMVLPFSSDPLQRKRRRKKKKSYEFPKKKVKRDEMERGQKGSRAVRQWKKKIGKEKLEEVEGGGGGGGGGGGKLRTVPWKGDDTRLSSFLSPIQYAAPALPRNVIIKICKAVAQFHAISAFFCISRCSCIVYLRSGLTDA